MIAASDSRAAVGSSVHYSNQFFSCMLASPRWATRGPGLSSRSGVRKQRSQEKGMSNMIRMVAVAMLAILVGCGQKEASPAAKQAADSASQAMDSAADAAKSAKDAA